MREKNDTLDSAIDYIIKNCPIDVSFNMYNILKNSTIEIEIQKVRQRMIDLGYIESVGNLPVKLTNHGRIVISRHGGHIAYLKFEKDKLKTKDKKENIGLWVPILFSFISIVISIWTHFDSKVDEEQLKKEIIQQLKKDLNGSLKENN